MDMFLQKHTMFRLLVFVCLCFFCNSSEVIYCESIRIDMCIGIGYNETIMPNWVGHDFQEVEYTLQTFVPLIDYVCSSQLKLFLCAAYVPMCTPKVPVPIGPCRSLCESVRSRCNPVLQGIGLPWPPALDCNRFPKENNHETMCMEGPDSPIEKKEDYPSFGMGSSNSVLRECPGFRKNLYVKSHRSDRCAPICDANILFTENDKHFSEAWVEAWCYSALGLALVAWFLTFTETKTNVNWSQKLLPLVWCHVMVIIGWSVRFISGRTATACGYDPQFPNVSLLLLVDGLSNPSCAATFILRYYFGMAACAWWAIVCLAWHRDLRSSCNEANEQLEMGHSSCRLPQSVNRSAGKQKLSVTQSTCTRFIAWGFPAFQTMAVIVARLVDADELLGSCFVGNQSEKGLQVMVAIPLFCYWIFGLMNLISGYLVHRRNKEITNSQRVLQLYHPIPNQIFSINNDANTIGIFLFIYCIPLGCCLLAVIYEFANIDIWLNEPTNGVSRTPMWPFLTRVFSEIMLGIICFAWILGPKISILLKRKFTPKPVAATKEGTSFSSHAPTYRTSKVAYSNVSYQTIRMPQQPQPVAQQLSGAKLAMTQITNNSVHKKKSFPNSHNYEKKKGSYKVQHTQQYRCNRDETIV